MLSDPKLVCIIVALVLFGISAWASSWPPTPNIWHGRLISAGLFFYMLSYLVHN